MGGCQGIDVVAQWLVIDAHRFGGILCLRLGFGDHHGNRLAHMAGLVGGQCHVRADKDIAAAGAGQFQIMLGLRQRAVRDRTQPIGGAIGARIDGQRPRHFHGGGTVDGQDAGVGVW